MKQLLFAVVTLALMTGCGVNSTFVYKPGAPATGLRPAPVKLAVVPFSDGTEDFTSRGGIFDMEHFFYNLAKAGYGGVISAIPPEMWAKAFADEMAVSGAFRSARFVYSPSEMTDEDLRIEGTLEKATIAGAFVGTPNEFALGLRAFRRMDAQPLWEKRVSRKWINEKKTFYDGCGEFEIQCNVDRHHADANRVMQGMFSEAMADLAATLAPLSGSPVEEELLSPATLPPESVNETIEGILKGK